ncbi:hypothetical protein DMW33_23815 [Vibrio parahaemolyticus]|nr:hypothetical protein [Vibrio parahaemolyticus]
MIEFIRKNVAALLRKKGYSESQAIRGGTLAADRYIAGGPFNGKAVDVCLASATQQLGKPEGKK